jgi:hypothetical protein
MISLTAREFEAASAALLEALFEAKRDKCWAAGYRLRPVVRRPDARPVSPPRVH